MPHGPYASPNNPYEIDHGEIGITVSWLALLHCALIRLADNVDGWVRPGALTALMGVSGAGKTALLDVLAECVTFGVITGEMLVYSGPRDSSFQRKTGYMQQQDIHLETSSVHEALRFSTLLR